MDKASEATDTQSLRSAYNQQHSGILGLYITCDQLSDVYIGGLAQQADQRRNASAVLQGNLVIVVSLAIHQVSQCSTSTPVHLGHSVVQQVHQQWDTSLPADLKRDEM